MSRMRELRRGGGAQRTAEYVGFLNGWSDPGSATVVQGQVVVFGMQGGIINSVGV